MKICCLIAVPFLLSLILKVESFGQDTHHEPVAVLDSTYFLTENLPLDSMLNTSVQALFKSLVPNHRFIGANWFCFRVTNTSPKEQMIILEIESTVYFELIELFRKENGILRSLGITGDPIHHSKRPTKDHALVFPMTLPPGSAGNYYLYAHSFLEYQLPLTIHLQESFENTRNINNMLYTFYYGFIAFVLVYSIFLSVIFRADRIYSHYTFYLLSLLLLFLHLNGFGYTFIWPDWPEFDKRIPFIAGVFSMIFLLKFTEQFLRPNNLKGSEQKALNYFFYAFCVSLFLSEFIYWDSLLRKIYVFLFIVLLDLSFFVFASIIAFRIYRAGFKPALFYICAFQFFFLSVLVYSVRSMISLNGWFVQHISQMANVVEVMTLTLGLTYWFKSNNDEKQNLLLRVNQQQKELAEERNRISRELHDSLGARLSTIGLSLQRLINETGNEFVSSIQTMTDTAMRELRDSIWAMNKDFISLEELEQRVNTLFWQYRKMNHPMELEMKLTGNAGTHQLSPDSGGHLYRIIQEAIQNSIKHSGASRLEVSILKGNGFVKVNIHDNGNGFQIPMEEIPNHFGLNNMKRRAELIGASFSIETATSSGTRVVIKLPDAR